jgi:hypothetical protein
MDLYPEQESCEGVDHFIDEQESAPKMDVECICPKCRHRYTVKMRWIGRGTPRKYCTACRASTVGSI